MGTWETLIESFSDVEVWVSLIALNLTIVGLSSLAEKRSVIGMEYGSYLLDKYKIHGKIRMFHLLVFVAVVDVISLITIWFRFVPWVVVLTFALLSLGTCVVIYFLFAYVLKVHKGVKLQIYKDEIQGLYNNNDKPCNFYGDVLVGMKNGDRTDKKLSSNVLQFFNQYNEDSIEAFQELFGPESVVYENYPLPSGMSHDYSVYEDGKDTGVRHISWEFFQMFRYSEIQERWILEILKLFNGKYADKFPRLRLYNVARALGQINRVGFSEGLHKYKFLDYLFPYIQEALKTEGDPAPGKRVPVERYLLEQLAVFMSNTMEAYPAATYTESVEKMLKGLLLPESYLGMVCHSERMAILSAVGTAEFKALLRTIEEEVHQKSIVFDFGNVLVDWSPDYLYTSLPDYDDVDYKFLKDYVLTQDWIAQIDACETMDEFIEAKAKDFPVFEDKIRLFQTHWMEMIKGETPGMCQLLKDLKKDGFHLFGLSNWCRETFVPAREKFDVLREIDDYLISGGLCKADGSKCPPKPDAEMFRVFLDRFGLDAQNCVFFDDNPMNVATATQLGMKAFLFENADQIRKMLL